MQKEKINKTIITAMKEKNTLLKDTMITIKANIQNEEIKLHRDLTESEELVILKRESKQMKESLDAAKSANREDLIEKFSTQLSYIEDLLPQMMSEDEILATLKANGAESGMKMGQLMGMIMKDHKDEVDGAVVKAVIQKNFL